MLGTMQDHGGPGRSRWRASLHRVAALTIGLFPLACTQLVIESTVGDLVLTEPSIFPSPVCHSSLGAYFLPKSFVRVEVKQYVDKDGAKPYNVQEDVEAIVRPDTRQVFCLDHLTSVATSDQVIIKKPPILRLPTSMAGVRSC